MVEECARRALDILDIPLAFLEPEFAMAAADDLALEADGGRRGSVCRDRGMDFPFGVPANFDDFLTSG